MSDELSEVLAALQRSGDDNSDPLNPGLADFQIVTRLKEWFAIIPQEPNRDLRPGQIIRHLMPSNAPMHHAGKPHIFVRHLPEPIVVAARCDRDGLFSNSAPARLDCVIAARTRDTISEFFSESRFWRAVDE